MTQALTVLETLHTIKPQLTNQCHIKRFGLFGSVIRGDQSPVDLVDIEGIKPFLRSKILSEVQYV